jgi:3-mercaptopyruvate sulfurtransferase SseA
MRMRPIAMAMVLMMALLVTITAPGQAQEVPRMTVEALRDRLAEPNLVVIDMRTGRDWTGSDRKIKGAKREEPGQTDWAKNYAPGQTLVIYCT